MAVNSSHGGYVMLHNEFDPPPSWYEPTWDWPEDDDECTYEDADADV